MDGFQIINPIHVYKNIERFGGGGGGYWGQFSLPGAH